MPPQLKVLLPAAGTAYPPTEPMPVNSTRPTMIKTEHFDGEISVWVKNYNGLKKAGDGDEFFGREDRKNMTYSLVVKGRFLTPISAEELEFGNVFEEEIASKLPWGSSIVMKFINYVDPNVKIDAYAAKPWALSPVLASMNYLSLAPASTAPSSSSSSNPTIIESAHSTLPHLRRDASEEVLSLSQDPETQTSRDGTPGWGEAGSKEAGDRRKKWFGKRENRESCVLDETVEVGMEFGNGLLDFSTLSVVIPPPFPFHINLASYWDGQPATYICCSKDRSITYWSMAFQIHDLNGEGDIPVEQEGEEGEKEKDAIVEKMEKVDKMAEEGAAPEKKSEAIDTAISEDVD